MYLGSGADFVNTPQLRLSTASSLLFDAGQFDVLSSTADDLALLRGEPLPGALGLQAIPQLEVMPVIAGDSPTWHQHQH